MEPCCHSHQRNFGWILVEAASIFVPSCVKGADDWREREEVLVWPEVVGDWAPPHLPLR